MAVRFARFDAAPTDTAAGGPPVNVPSKAPAEKSPTVSAKVGGKIKW